MPSILAHAPGPDFFLALAVVAAIYLFLLAIVALAVFLLAITVTHIARPTIRARHLLWLLPLILIGVGLLVEPWLLPDWVPLPELFRRLALVTTVLSAWLGVGTVAAMGRLAATPGSVAPLQALPPRPPADTLPGQFREGLVVPLDGLAFLWGHPRLGRHAVIPVLLNLLITLLALAVLLLGAAVFATKIHPWFPATWWGLVLEILVAAALLVLVGALALGLAMLLGGILGEYFHARLAREVDILLGLKPEEIVELPLARQVADALGVTGRALLLNLSLLLLNIIPVLGFLLAITLGAYFNCSTAGGKYLSLPLELRGLARDARQTFLRRHRWRSLGLGSGVLVLTFIPLLGSVLLATAAAGAVLLYRRLQLDSPQVGNRKLAAGA